MPDKEIFDRAKKNGFIIIITRDADFPALVTQYGSPPKIIKLNTGKYSGDLKSAIKLLQKTKTEIVYIE